MVCCCSCLKLSNSSSTWSWTCPRSKRIQPVQRESTRMPKEILMMRRWTTMMKMIILMTTRKTTILESKLTYPASCVNSKEKSNPRAGLSWIHQPRPRCFDSSWTTALWISAFFPTSFQLFASWLKTGLWSTASWRWKTSRLFRLSTMCSLNTSWTTKPSSKRTSLQVLAICWSRSSRRRRNRPSSPRISILKTIW